MPLFPKPLKTPSHLKNPRAIGMEKFRWRDVIHGQLLQLSVKLQALLLFFAHLGLQAPKSSQVQVFALGAPLGA